MTHKIILIATILLGICKIGLTQTPKEFEGLIKYKHKVIAKVKGYNVKYDYSGIGYNSEFYYKSGHYKWLTFNAYFLMDLFDPIAEKDYFLTTSSDTLMALDNTKADLSIIDSKTEFSVDTIAGHVCNVFIFHAKPIDKEGPISIRKYYYSNNFYVNPVHFSNCKSNGMNFIYSNIKSIALRIVLEWPNKIITWEAEKVQEMNLKNDFFKLDKNKAVKDL
jgi:hypothetical protein